MTPTEIAAIAGLPGLVLGWLGHHFTSRRNGNGKLIETVERKLGEMDGHVCKAIEEQGERLREDLRSAMTVMRVQQELGVSGMQHSVEAVEGKLQQGLGEVRLALAQWRPPAA